MSETSEGAAAMLLAEANAIEDCHTRGDGDWTGEDEAKASHDAMWRQPFARRGSRANGRASCFSALRAGGIGAVL